MLRELVDVYFQEARKSLAAINACLQRGDRDGLNRAAHHLKGSSQMMRADLISELSLKLESASVLNAESAASTLEQLSKAVREAEHSAARFLRGLESSVSTRVSLE